MMAEFPGDNEDNPADDVSDPEAREHPYELRFDSREYVLQGEREGGDGGAEQRSLDLEVFEDSLGAEAGDGGAGDEADECDDGQSEARPSQAIFRALLNGIVTAKGGLLVTSSAGSSVPDDACVLRRHPPAIFSSISAFRKTGVLFLSSRDGDVGDEEYEKEQAAPRREHG